MLPIFSVDVAKLKPFYCGDSVTSLSLKTDHTNQEV